MRLIRACGAAAAVVFVAAFLVEGATRGDGYDPLRHPVSSLAIGDLGWTQTANFIVTGLLMLAFAISLRGTSRWGATLLTAVAVGFTGAGIFVTDPVNGYPPAAPTASTTAGSTTGGTLHDLFSMLVFAGLPAACLVYGRRFAGWGRPGWAAYSIATGVVFLIGFVIAGAGFSGAEGLTDVAGLFQRLTLVVGLAWVAFLDSGLRTVYRT
ncbi:DUF998 domain-containing protein [Nonomuraea sp. NPDC059194]|uniref:DUF998 domain-containing protein n=1 Tax=Nonomuraea sp. NPDC059194 TaxID=3346764 RepID=UPI00367B3F8D